MLHALLHGKLDPSRPEPQRIEDALTSTVFGTLVWVGAWDVLRLWLCPEQAAPSRTARQVRDCWFWPRLGSVVPDVVVRLDDVLVVAEAKLRSGRHDRPDLDEDDDGDPRDQLVRQYRCVTAPSDRRARYAEPIEQAIADCRVTQAYVVDARRVLHARRECEESHTRLPPGVSLRLRTWQDLYRLLSAAEFAQERWAADLKAYLAFSGLDSFQGIRHCVAQADAMRPVVGWRSRSHGFGFRDAALAANGFPVRSLLSWGALPQRMASLAALTSIDERIVNGEALRMLDAWCRRWNEEPTPGRGRLMRRQQGGT